MIDNISTKSRVIQSQSDRGIPFPENFESILERHKAIVAQEAASHARRYRVDYEDLYQEGVLAVASAASRAKKPSAMAHSFVRPAVHGVMARWAFANCAQIHGRMYDVGRQHSGIEVLPIDTPVAERSEETFEKYLVAPEQSQALVDLNGALEKLKPQYRLAVELRYGLTGAQTTYSDISESMGIPLGSAFSIVKTGCKRLKKILLEMGAPVLRHPETTAVE